ncbi:MAG: hypothetical protein GXX83_08440 [Gaiellales bacterium]|nr:hypothetical protein [Gaiellales bacterium]
MAPLEDGGSPRLGGDRIDWEEIAKWVLLVLAAGFVGQFGKRLADYLLARRRRRLETEADRQTPEHPQIERPPHDRADVEIAPMAAKKLDQTAAKTDGGTAPKEVLGTVATEDVGTAAKTAKEDYKIAKKAAKAEAKRAKKNT